jgi:S1-C subfamily serine protease
MYKNYYYMNIRVFLIIFSITFLISLLAFLEPIYYYKPIFGQEISKSLEKSTDILDLTPEEIFTRASNSVVQITIIDPSSGLEQGLGSGFVFDKKGHIITNNHVVPIDQKFAQYIVTFANGNTYNAEIVGKDQFSDLAVIKISNTSPSDLIPLPLGNSSTLKVGNTVVAIGNPFGLSGSLTVGVVSGLGRLLPSSEENSSGSPFGPSQQTTFNIPDVIQTDAAINPGNSGGPLLNLKGQVIGVNSAIFSNTGSYSGIGFAVPSDIVKKVTQSIIATGKYSHPYLGVIGMDVTPELAKLFGLEKTIGFLVTDITQGSPAEKSGLREGTISYNNRGEFIDAQGDIIVGIDGKPVRKIDDILTHLEKEKKVGDKVILTLIRDKKFINVELQLGERPTHSDISRSSGTELFDDSQSKSSNGGMYSECLKIMPKSLCDLFR